MGDLGAWKGAARHETASRGRHLVAGLVAVITLLASSACTNLFPVSPTYTPIGSWRDHLGVITSIDPGDLDAAAALGVGWVRIDWKQGWGPDDDWTGEAAYVDRAHALGLEVMQTCQRSDLDYTSPGNVESFATWCAGWVDIGVDALEIGNEWNWPFWFPSTSPRRAADVTEVVAKAIRARSRTVTIVTNGWAPVQSPPALRPATAMQTMLAHQPNIKWRANAVGWHPYVTQGHPGYSTSDHDPAMDLFLSSQVLEMARVAPRQEQWFTEFGTPSNRESGGIVFDEKVQARQLQRHFDAIATWHRSGIRIGVSFVYSLTEGSWSKSFGIFYADANGDPGTAKRGAAIVKRQATRPW